MSKLSGFLTRLRRAINRRGFEQQMAAEMREHLEHETAERMEQGEDPVAARRRAALAFGHADSHKEQVRDRRFGRGAGDFTQAMGHAVRRLRRSPAFTLTVLGTLALCIGANIAIFAVVDAVVLRPLPFPASDRLVRIFNTYPNAGIENDGSSFTNYYERRGEITGISHLAIFHGETAVVGEPGSTTRDDVMRVSPEFFDTLGISVARGRAFTDAEMTFQTADVAILTDDFWRQHLHADPNALGRRIRVDGSPRTIVGILPPGYRFLSSTARLYLPLASNPDARGPKQRYDGSVAETIARLKPGISLAEAQAQIDAHHAAMEAGRPYPNFARMTEMGFRSLAVPIHADHVKSVRPILLLIQGAGLSLLLIGVINLVSLLYLRASSRAKEMAVRQALGAGRRHVVRDVFLETIILALSGGLVGLGVGAGGITLLARLGIDQLPLGATVQLDDRVVIASMLGALVIGLGLAAPLAGYTLRRMLAPVLQTATRGATISRTAQRVRHGLIVGQIALVFVLLSGAGLLGLSLQQVLATPPGFRPDQLLTARLTLPFNGYRNPGDALAFIEQLIPAVQGQPMVASVALSTAIPFGGRAVSSSTTVEGSVPDAGPRRAHHFYGVAGDYWGTMGIPLREGRLLDDPRESNVCVVDEAFARLHWPGESALGRRLSVGPTFDPARAETIVGVVGAVQQSDLADPRLPGAVYFPFATYNSTNLSIVIRGVGDPGVLASALRRNVQQIDAELPVDDLKLMRTRIDDSLIARRSPAVLAGAFAGIALLLATVGIYGAIAYVVSQRRREIGVRLALGAMPGQVTTGFLCTGARLLGCGIALGLPGVWVAGRIMQSQLFGVGAFPLGIVSATAVVMTAVVLSAILIPARRAAGVSPMEILRDE